MALHGVLSDVLLALLQDAQAQKVEASSTIHLALDELEPVNLAFDVALVPWQPESFAYGVDVSFESGCEPGQRGITCGLKPRRKCLEVPVLEHAEETLGKLRESADFG